MAEDRPNREEEIGRDDEDMMGQDVEELEEIEDLNEEAEEDQAEDK